MFLPGTRFGQLPSLGVLELSLRLLKLAYPRDNYTTLRRRIITGLAIDQQIELVRHNLDHL